MNLHPTAAAPGRNKSGPTHPVVYAKTLACQLHITPEPT